MKVLLLDGHPDAGRLTTHLLDVHERALPAVAEITRIAVRDRAFTPVLEGQVLGFCGFAPVRMLTLGPVGENAPPQVGGTGGETRPLDPPKST